VDRIPQVLADFVLVDAGNFRALDNPARVDSSLLRHSAEQ